MGVFIVFYKTDCEGEASYIAYFSIYVAKCRRIIIIIIIKTKISHLLYMDDLKLIAKSEEELQKLTQTVKTFSEGY